MLVVEDVNGEPPWGTSLSSAQKVTWDNFTLFGRVLEWKTRQFLPSSENPFLRVLSRSKREFYASEKWCIHSTQWNPPGRAWDQSHQGYDKYDSGLKKIPLFISSWWLQEPWQPSGSRREDGNWESTAHHLPAVEYLEVSLNFIYFFY